MRCCMAAGVVCLAGAAPALGVFTLEYRIVERTGQTVVSPADPVLDCAIQARVPGGVGLRNFDFDMHIVGEPETYGTLARGLITNLDGTYASGIGIAANVGRGGLAKQYSYNASINPAFNGLINASAGTFTNGPDQEIGLIAGVGVGPPLVATPGMDVDGDGNPDTWIGNGTGQIPANQTTAPLDAALAGPYFASNEFIDVYRFRYTVGVMTPRTLHLALENPHGGVFTVLGYANGLWGTYINSVDGTPATTGLDIQVVPAPSASGAVVLVLAGAAGRRSRRTASSARESTGRGRSPQE